MTSLLWPLTVALALVGPPADDDRAALPDAVVPHCLVALIEEAAVPADEAGRIVSLEVREGQEVQAGTLLARIDDQPVQHQRAVAEVERESAQAEADSDVKIRNATATRDKADADYVDVRQLNKRSPGTISKTEERRKELDLRVAALQIEQSTLERRVAGFTRDKKQAEVAAADTNLARRQIQSPLTGRVIQVLKHQGEWAQPGETVLRIVRLDRLRVEGYVNASEYEPADLDNRQVTIEVQLARGRVERFEGRVTFVNPLVETDGDFQIWAEVVNRAERGHWLLRPGLMAEMTIRLGDETAGD